MMKFRSIRALGFNNIQQNVILARRMSSEVTSRPCAPAVRFFYNDVYKVVLPEKHRFPMTKYRLVRDLLQSELADRIDVEYEVSPLCGTESRL